MCCRFLTRLCLAVLLLLWLTPAFPALKSIAFYYGEHLPVDALHAFDAVVVHPDSSPITPKNYDTKHSHLFAYVSVGEVDPTMSFAKEIKPSWVIGENTIWKAMVMDETNPAWRAFFINRIIGPLWKQGYRGFFLDTMDSYQLAANTEKERRAQRQGIITLIRAIKKKYPTAKLILNRGFQVLPAIHALVYAFAVESLYGGWNQSKQRYQPIPKVERMTLLKELSALKKWHLPIIVIDYAPPKDRALARKIAIKIEKDGFIPWVADGHLESLGVSSVEVIPRKVLLIYDSSGIGNLFFTNALHDAAMPLEYLGYVPKLQNIRAPLPSFILRGRYAAIVVWPGSSTAGPQPQWHRWLLKQKRVGVPIIFLSSFGFPLENSLLEPFGLTIGSRKAPMPPIRIAQKNPNVGYETQISTNIHDFSPIYFKQGTSWLTLESANKVISNIAAITPWGGYVLDPYCLVRLPNGETRWLINPIAFFAEALHHPLMPIADTTTENGRRLMLAHVDGDAFISRAEWPNGSFAGKEMEDLIFKKYRIPTTVSIIQAEISPFGKITAKNKAYFETARSIFKLPWIEIASHSYSHPFNWIKVQDAPPGSEYNLPVKGYHYSAQKEVTGSVDFINRTMAPPGKKCKVFLWSGEANPDAAAVALTYHDGLMNMNGGDTRITLANRSLTNISPLGIDKGGYFQVYAPIMNENIYTRNWLGPFYGFQKVIQTFELTNKPYRIKPIDIYYHFYSATKHSALAALNKVYQWALKQKVLNIFVSQYSHIVLSFNRLVVARDGSGYLIRHTGTLKEFRIPAGAGYPDLLHSRNVIGFSPYHKGYYVHLGPASQSYLQLTSRKPSLPYLVSANGIVTAFTRHAKRMTLTLKAFVPLKLTLVNITHCTIRTKKGTLKGTTDASKLTRFSIPEHQDVFTIQC